MSLLHLTFPRSILSFGFYLRMIVFFSFVRTSSHIISYAVHPHSTYSLFDYYFSYRCLWLARRNGFIHHIIPPTNHRMPTVSVPNIVPSFGQSHDRERLLCDVLDTPRSGVSTAMPLCTVLRITGRLSCHLPSSSHRGAGSFILLIANRECHDRLANSISS